MHISNPKVAYFVALLCGLVVGWWSLTTPLFETPDEQAHFESVEFMASHGRMPQGDEYDMSLEMRNTELILGIFRDSGGRNLITYHPEYRLEYTNTLVGKYEHEIQSQNTERNREEYVWSEAARYPRIYYDYESWWLALVSKADIIQRLFVARLGSVMLSTVTALVIWKTGFLIFKKSHAATVLTVMVMLQPMFSFLSSGVNSDNLHNLLFFAVIYGCLSLIEYGVSKQLVFILTSITVLDIYTKPQGFIAIPLIVVALLIRAYKERRIAVLKWIFLFILGIGTLTYIQWDMFDRLLTSTNHTGVQFIEFIRFSADKLIAQNSVWYWGVFKWLGVVLPREYWRLANRIVLVGIVGLGIYGYKWLRGKVVVTELSKTLFLFMTTVIYACAIYWYDWQYHKSFGYSLGIQARYFFPSLLAHMSLLLIGLSSLSASSKVRTWFHTGIVAFFIWLQLGGTWTLLSSYYDLNSFSTFVTQVSQYKPVYAKGLWWYIWTLLYGAGILGLIGLTLSHHMPPGLNPKIGKQQHKLSK